MLEKTVEAYLVERVRALGGTAYKFTSPARASVPDRIVILPPGRIFFVEVKRPGGKLTRGQEREHEHLRRLGADVRVLDSIGAINSFLNEVQAAAADGVDTDEISGKCFIVIGHGESDIPEAKIIARREDLLDAVLGMIYTHASEAPDDVRAEYAESLSDDDEWAADQWSVDFEIGGIVIWRVGLHPVSLRAAVSPATAEAREPVGSVRVNVIHRSGANEVGEPIFNLSRQFEALLDASPGVDFPLYSAPADAGEAVAWICSGSNDFAPIVRDRAAALKLSQEHGDGKIVPLGIVHDVASQGSRGGKGGDRG